MILLSAMGDAINALPMIRQLRRLQPDAQIDVLTSPRAHAIFEGFPSIDEILSVDIYGAAEKMFGRFRRLIADVRAREYDVVIDTEQYSALTGLVAMLSRAPRRVGFSTPGKQVDEAYTDVVAYVEDRHESHCFYDLLAPLFGAQTYPNRLEPIAVTTEERLRAEELLQILGYRSGPIVALHPLSGSTATSRRWPVPSFVWLGQALIEHQDANVLLVGSPDERTALNMIAERIGPETMVAAGRTSLHELAALLSVCDVFVGNDSGPMHLAAAMGTRTIGLFGPNTPVKWGPLGSGNHVLSAHLPCSPCIKVSHGQFQECAQPICMTSIRPEQALAVVEEVLSEKGVYIQ